MADGTKIEWADATVNAINGCSLASPGCTNCYAMRLAGTRLRNHPSREGLTTPSKAGPVWNGTVRLSETALLQPLRWRAPRVIFWNAHGDTFHDEVPDEWIDRMFAVVSLAHWHSHLVLTKRSSRMREYFSSPDVVERIDRQQAKLFSEHCRKSPHAFNMKRPAANWPLPNLWLGVSVEDQDRAEERIPDLIETPAAGAFLSCEPMLGPIDLEEWLICPNARGGLSMDPSTGQYECCRTCDWTGFIGGIQGVIVGGESGRGARPMHPAWARNLRDQCADAGVDFHFKQWGDWRPYCSNTDDFTDSDPTGEYGRLDARHVANGDERPGPQNLLIRVGKKVAGRELYGAIHDDLPWRRAS